MLTILPFPDSRFLPNKKNQHRYMKDQRDNQRNAGYLAALPYRRTLCPLENHHLSLKFIPKNHKHGDPDNLLAASKYMIDGVARGLDLDDKLFRPITIDIGWPDKKNPRTELEIL